MEANQSEWEKWLRRYGAVGAAIAVTINLLTAHWLVAMPVAVGFVVSFWEGALAAAMTPSVYVGVGAFLVALWTAVGISVLIDRRKPRLIKADQDYRYGLTCEGIAVQYDPNNHAAMLRFMVILRNFSQAPIFYTIKRFEVRFGKTSLPPVEDGKLKGYLSRGGGKGSGPGTFERDDIKNFFGREVEGTITIEVHYGHPERAPVRKFTLNHKLTLDFRGQPGTLPLVGADNPPPAIGVGAEIVSEADEAI